MGEGEIEKTRHMLEQVVDRLRKAEAAKAEGRTVTQAYRRVIVTDET